MEVGKEGHVAVPPSQIDVRVKVVVRRQGPSRAVPVTSGVEHKIDLSGSLQRRLGVVVEGNLGSKKVAVLVERKERRIGRKDVGEMVVQNARSLIRWAAENLFALAVRH